MKGTKSHKIVTFHVFAQTPPFSDFQQILHIERCDKCSHVCEHFGVNN